MKNALIVFAAVLLIIPAGCLPTLETGKPTLLTVDFQQGQTLQYKFVSSRDIEMDWGMPSKNKTGKSKIDKSSESMEMVVAYTPVKVDPYGLTTIEAMCKSVKTSRSSSGSGRAGTSRDAAETLSGATFTFTVDAAGRIEDYSQLEKLITETGEKAFRPGSKAGRIKEPDMIDDFIAAQWFLWDSVSSIKKAAKGVRTGQSWKSKLSIPLPMVIRKARDVTYTLDEIRQTEKGQIAVIRSSYALAESVPGTWPKPYTGSFQMSGRFGFLSNYNFLDLQGQGEELFNIDVGRTEKYNQQYKVQLDASFPMGFNIKPKITIEQKLTVELIE
ncbi:MAG: hypothetical protein WC476_04065 [Phycisphaerae bacterium]